MGLGALGESKNCPSCECPATTAYCNWGLVLQGTTEGSGMGYLGWGRPSWGEDSSWGSRGRRRNPNQTIFTYHRALPAGLALPRNKVLSFQTKRLSSEAKFCCSSYSFLKTKQLCFQKAQGDSSPTGSLMSLWLSLEGWGFTKEARVIGAV